MTVPAAHPLFKQIQRRINELRATEHNARQQIERLQERISMGADSDSINQQVQDLASQIACLDDERTRLEALVPQPVSVEALYKCEISAASDAVESHGKLYQDAKARVEDLEAALGDARSNLQRYEIGVHSAQARLDAALADLQSLRAKRPKA